MASATKESTIMLSLTEKEAILIRSVFQNLPTDDDSDREIIKSVFDALSDAIGISMLR